MPSASDKPKPDEEMKEEEGDDVGGEDDLNDE